MPNTMTDCMEKLKHLVDALKSRFPCNDILDFCSGVEHALSAIMLIDTPKSWTSYLQTSLEVLNDFKCPLIHSASQYHFFCGATFAYENLLIAITKEDNSND